MADFIGSDLRGARFERADLSGALLKAVDLTGARLHGVDLTGTVMRGVELVNVDINGEIQNVRINGVDVWPLVDAELNRRYPDRAKMRPVDPAGFVEAWDTIERRSSRRCGTWCAPASAGSAGRSSETRRPGTR